VGKEILTYDDLLQIVELIKSAESFSEFHLKIGDIELDLRKSDAGASAPPAASANTPLPAADAAASAKLAPAPADQVAAGSKAAVEVPAGAVVIKSPMVGTFYRSPEPGAKPFVEVGQRVSPDTTVCIIEVMKLMNSISAGCEGTVTHVLANDAEAVDVGQLLIIIDPKA
jgi:acetyl-CoA carboxylase biotin carboxyl carrier protein